MATLTPTLTLASTDITANETLNLTISDTLTVSGPCETKRLIIASGSTNVGADNTIFAAGSYTTAHVLLYNTSVAASGEIITIGTTAAAAALAATNMSLNPGEFAFFPWDSTVSLVADASSGNPVLEARIFQAAY
tara:strand:- start:363 stop:767 length:405 start_codon:yes stop_codon:yes gene_type:complete